MTHLKQKVTIATSYNNEHCQCMQNVSQRYRIKLAKFHFIILRRFGVIEEKPKGREESAPGPLWYIERVKYLRPCRINNMYCIVVFLSKQTSKETIVDAKKLKQTGKNNSHLFLLLKSNEKE